MCFVLVSFRSGNLTSSPAFQDIASTFAETLGSNAPALPSNIPPVDTSAPHISLLGNGTQYVDMSGNSVMLDLVEFNSKWLDPGATALDLNAFGIQVDLSSALRRFGVGGVNTSIVTPPGAIFGFSVEYHVSVEAIFFRTICSCLKMSTLFLKGKALLETILLHHVLCCLKVFCISNYF